MSRGRLLAVSPLPGMAGGEVMLTRLLPELAGLGWRVRLTVPGAGRLRDAAGELGIETVRLPLGPPERRTGASYAGALVALGRARSCDVVLLNGLSTQRVLPALRLWGRPALLHVDNPLPDAPSAWGRPGFWNHVRVVLTDSLVSAAECVAAGAPGGSVHAILPPAWSGPDPPGRRAERRPAAARVGFVGQLEPRKGVLELVEAAASFLSTRPAATLTLVGEPPAGADGGYMGRIEAAIRASGAGERIRLAGFRSGAAAAMGDFDLLAVPSLAEPYGTVAAEAAAAGVAVVASRVGGLQEVVEDGETGVLVAPGDPAALAEAVGSLLDDADRLRRLGDRALERAERFSPVAYAERVDALLRETLAPLSSPA